MKRYRNLLPPMTALFLLGGAMGCEPDDPKVVEQRQRADLDRRREAWERQKLAEREGPSAQKLSEIRMAAQAFLTEHHPELTTQGFDFTPMTPNLMLVGAKVTQKDGSSYVKQFTAERLADVHEDEDDGTVSTNGDYLWVIDYADPAKMANLADRHGFSNEVRQIQEHHPQAASYGHRSWLDDYLLWHFLFHRPSPIGYSYGPGSGFRPYGGGYRFTDAGRPFREEDRTPYSSIPAVMGGRSNAFVSGRAWSPPRVDHVPGLNGKPFAFRGNGGYAGTAPRGVFASTGGRSGTASVARGGFGGAGHASGGFSGS